MTLSSSGSPTLTLQIVVVDDGNNWSDGCLWLLVFGYAPKQLYA